MQAIHFHIPAINCPNYWAAYEATFVGDIG